MVHTFSLDTHVTTSCLYCEGVGEGEEGGRPHSEWYTHSVWTEMRRCFVSTVRGGGGGREGGREGGRPHSEWYTHSVWTEMRRCFVSTVRGGGEGGREGGREGDPTVSGTHVQFGHTCDNILSLLCHVR